MSSNKWDRFVHQHYRDAANGVEHLLISADQARIELVRDRLPGAVAQPAGGDFLVQLLEERRSGRPQRLVRLGATHCT